MAGKNISDIVAEICSEELLALDCCPVKLGGRNRVNILALGDVGTTMMTGFRLLGSDVISSIGICDINKENLQRLEMEMNQISYPPDSGYDMMPPVEIVDEKDIFDCDVFVFCASRGIPELGTSGDVRMAQLSANREIIAQYGEAAARAEFKGLVAVVSDPVDPLSKEFLITSGLKASQIQGYGLGVMNARAMYYAERDPRFAQYLTEGRAFGPHGEDLVIADSLTDYDDQLSKELTSLTVTANMKVRKLGYKPYIAPALSSASLSILMTLRGQWHYSSLYLGDGTRGAFLGVRNRMAPDGPEYEDAELCDSLYARVRHAYINQCVL